MSPRANGIRAGLVLLAILAGPSLAAPLAAQRNGNARDDWQLDRIPFDGRAAFEHLLNICELGPRPSGSEGMQKQQTYLADHFESLGGAVDFQTFEIDHPDTGQSVEIKNMIVEWHPDRQERILICAHYDTRPRPDLDAIDPNGVFLGANDGASGVALLCELARHMPELPGPLGVDFVLFDAEEFVFVRRRDPLFVGSTYFATEYAERPPEHVYKYGVLVDMVGDMHLDLYLEGNSLRYAPDLTRDIWNTARRLRVREFILRVRHEIRDDHLPLNLIARIPTTDIIDFDYPAPEAPFSYWHTREDTPDKCSPLSLAKVGWVLVEWLKEAE